MDRVLKAHFDSFRDKGVLPPELRELNDGVVLFDDVEKLKVWTNNRKGIRWADAEGNVLFGAVDEILKKGNKLIVLDFKTRGFPLKEDTAGLYQDQLDVYNFLLRKNGYEAEDYGFLVFYYPEAVDVSGHVKFHAELVKMEVSVKNAERLFRQAIDVLNGKLPEAGEECSYCQWRDLKV
jgi:hypothetical protein